MARKVSKKTSNKKTVKSKTVKKPTKVVPQPVEERFEFYDEPKKWDKERIFNVVFWVVIILLFFIWVFDFNKVRREKEPVFCIYEQNHKFDDGSVKECFGLGYKVYTYDRDSLKGIQYGSFFMKMEK